MRNFLKQQLQLNLNTPENFSPNEINDAVVSIQAKMPDNENVDRQINTNAGFLKIKRKSDEMIEELKKSRLQREKIIEKLTVKQETTNNDPIGLFFQCRSYSKIFYPATRC